MTTNPEPMDRRQLLRDALLRMDEMQAKLDATEKAKTEPIAIIGMGCRFPGGVDGPESYWKLLSDGIDAVHEIPKSRMDSTIYGESDFPPVWYAGLLDKIDGFDASFFGISPREATSLDPQQRLTLEVGWEALENAGIAPDTLAGSQTGVFMGVSTNDFAQLLRMQGSDYLDVYSATGGALNAIPGRLAYTLGLNGPSVAVDTACSSSLVAIHLASQSLRSGESNLALAGGVNMVLMPEAFICFSRWGMMASDGRCKTFDASADGFVRSEGCGMVVLKRLSDAIADGDTILALIRGSAVNQDGRSSGLTVPNGPAQQAVIRRALSVAKVKPAEVSYIETHGTGTLIGDPIEVEAIGVVLGEGRPKDLPLVIGAVKTNIGHAESASGIAGLIKVVLSMQHHEIPRNLHFHEPNARIPWPDFPVIVPQEQTDWTPINGRRLAGISGFGFSGTNAHVVLEEFNPPQPVSTSEADSNVSHAQILTLSGASEAAVNALAGLYRDYFQAHPDVSLADVASSAINGRAQFPYRMAVVGATAGDVEATLSAFLAGEGINGVVQGKADKKVRQKIAFMFTGQGSQYIGMGRGLYETQPIFRAALDQCDQLLRPYLKQPLLSVLYPAEGEVSPLDETTFTQPALFALEYALAQVWMSWGIQPAAVMGHSVGEYVAAVIAGVFSLEDGLKLIAERGRLMGMLPTGGQMAAVFADEATVKAAIAPYPKQVSLAAVNGPENIVISGAGEVVEAILENLRVAGVKARKLNVSHAFHSPLMEPMLDAFTKVAQSVKYSQPHIKLISNVTGEAAGAEIAKADYWRKHVREAVQFAKAVETLNRDGFTTYLEVGPSPTLIGMGQRVLADGSASWAASLRSGRDDWAQMLIGLGGLYVQGVLIDWTVVNGHAPRRKVALPTYPFQRERYWPAVTVSAQPKRKAERGVHPLLGRRLRSASQDVQFEAELSIEAIPYLNDHRIYGTAVLPGSAYMEMGLAAAQVYFSAGNGVVQDLTIQDALILPVDETRVVQVIVTPENDVQAGFKIFSLQDDHWKLHASGRLATAETTPAAVDLGQLAQGFSDEQDVGAYYERFSEIGLNYGATFQSMTQLWRRDGESLGQIQTPVDLSTDGYMLHPALLDACFQLIGAAIPQEADDVEGTKFYLPVGLKRLTAYQRAGEMLWGHVTLHNDAGQAMADHYTATLQLLNEQGEMVAEVEGLLLLRPSGDALWRIVSQNAFADTLYEIVWRQDSSEAKATPTGRWLILGDQGGVGMELANALNTSNVESNVIFAADGGAESLTSVLHEKVYDRVIYLWGLDAQTVEGGKQLGSFDILSVIQVLASSDVQRKPRLWVVTRNAVETTPDMPTSINVFQAPLWGLGRTASLEHPDFWGGLVDLDAQEDDIALLAQTLAQGEGENQIALRGGERFAARMAEYQAADRAEMPIHEDATYLVTGGLRGLGLLTAGWLVGQGARHLVLMGRSAPDEATVERLHELEVLGAEIMVVPGNVANAEFVAALINDIQQKMPPLRGIIHSAGTLDDGLLIQQTPARFETVMSPKINGAWNLHHLTEEIPLDFFVLYSSASAVFGSAGQGNYTAANSFMDALAYQRRANGLPALSINWGAWSEVGMAATLGIGDRVSGQGIKLISPDDGLKILDYLLSGQAAQVIAVPINWSKFERQFGAGDPPLLTDLLRRTRQTGGRQTIDMAKQSNWAERLQVADVGERSSLALQYAQAQVSRVMGIPASQPVSPEQSLHMLGLDSLMAMELKNRVEADLKVVVPVATLLEGPTIARFAEIVVEKLNAASGSSSVQNGAQEVVEDETVQLITNLDNLSEAEIDALLNQMLTEKDDEG